MILSSIPQLTFRTYQASDYTAIQNLMQVCFSDLNDAYASLEEMQTMHRLYERGQIVCLLEGQIIGATTSRIVPYHKYKKLHTLSHCADVKCYEKDTIQGNAVYGLDIFVNPTYQNLKIGKKIVEILIKNTFEDNFYAFIGTSRVVNYRKYQQEMDCKTYVQKVKSREIYDPALSFHFSYGVECSLIIPNFCPEDEPSAGYGVFLELSNPTYNPDLSVYLTKRRVHFSDESLTVLI